MGIEEQYTPGEVAKMHSSANETAAQEYNRMMNERNVWKLSAEMRQATCDSLARLADQWKRRAEEAEAKLRVRAALVAEMRRLLSAMRPGHHERNCPEGPIHEATCQEAGEALAESEKLD